jgi:hypothetical protein
MDDLRSVLEEAFGVELGEDTEMLQNLFTTMDVNGDGVVTKEEWASQEQPHASCPSAPLCSVRQLLTQLCGGCFRQVSAFHEIVKALVQGKP